MSLFPYNESPRPLLGKVSACPPQDDKRWQTASDKHMMLSVVGACQTCGSPIYGKSSIMYGEIPIAIRSCQCIYNHTFENTVKTK